MMDMNQEFDENYAMHFYVETDMFDTGNTVVTTLEERCPKTSTGRKKKKKGLKLYMLFVLIAAMNLLVSYDHGVLPAAAINIMQDLKLSQAQLGWLGTIVFVGISIGKPSSYYSSQVLLHMRSVINKLALKSNNHNRKCAFPLTLQCLTFRFDSRFTDRTKLIPQVHDEAIAFERAGRPRADFVPLHACQVKLRTAADEQVLDGGDASCALPVLASLARPQGLR